MDENLFVKQNHKNFKVAFSVCYICVFVLITIVMTNNPRYRLVGIVFLSITFILFFYLVKLFEACGIYVIDGEIYYKTIRMRKVNVKNIVAVNIIKSEAQVNLAWSAYEIKDKRGNVLYSMIFLSRLEDGMEEYPYGDIEFIRKYKKDIIMTSIYDERLICILRKRINNLIVISS